MTKRLTALVAACLFLLAACGSDSGTKTSTGDNNSSDTTEKTTTTVDEVAFDDWVDEVNQICADGQQANDELDADFENAYTDAQDGDFEALTSLFEDAQTEFNDRLEAIQAAGTPDEHAHDAQGWLDSAQSQIELIDDVLAAAQDEDLATLDDRLTKASLVDNETEQLATDLGLDDCVSDDSSSSTTTTDGSGSSNDAMSGSGGMSGNGVIDAPLLESAIESDYFDALSLTIVVTCPENRPLQAGDVFQCEGPDEEGDVITFDVTQVDADGNVTYESVAVNGISG